MKWSSSEQILEESGISVAPPKRNRSSHVLMLAPLAPAITGEVISKVGHKEEEKEEKKTSMLFFLIEIYKINQFPSIRFWGGGGGGGGGRGKGKREGGENNYVICFDQNL